MPRLTPAIAAIAVLALFAPTLPTAEAAPPGHAKQIAHHKAKHQGGGPPRRSKGPASGDHSSRRQGGPPPWAPAHGYRGKYVTYQTHDRREVRIPESDLVLRAGSGLDRCNREVVGAIFGGAAGAVTGSRVGGGSGKTAATVAGAILGALIGGNIGRAMDQVDQNCIGQTLERAETGRPVVWRNPDNGGDYRVTPTDTYQTADGRYCREYTTTVVIGGRSERARGTACRQPDGSWRRGG